MSPAMTTLYVITTISNPANFESRYRLYKDFATRIQQPNVVLYTIELATGDQEFSVTDRDNVHHIQLRSKHALWYKENLVNIAITYLPNDWEYVAWIDADVSFARRDWAEETIQQLRQHAFVQMFSHVVDLGPHFEPLRCHAGFVYQHLNAIQRADSPGAPNQSIQAEFGQPGYAWAARRRELALVSGLIDWSIMGANDYFMALALIGRLDHASTRVPRSNYAHMLLRWQDAAELHIQRNIGYVGTTLLHYWHGNRRDRHYGTRWRVLADHRFDPAVDLVKNTDGLLEFTNAKPALHAAIREYFRARNEDGVDTA
jgi:hypothetical protein